MNLFPSRSALRKIRQRGLSWNEIARDLHSPEFVCPVAGYATRQAVYGQDYIGYVEPYEGVEGAFLVVGVRNREAVTEPVEPVVGVEPKVSLPRAPGGSGTRWPTTWGELVGRLSKIPDVQVSKGSRHLIVYKSGQQVEALPITPSDHRALLNACTRLSRRGLDVSRTGS